MQKILITSLFLILPTLVFAVLVGAIYIGIISSSEAAIAGLLVNFLLLLLKIKQPLPKVATVIFYLEIMFLIALALFYIIASWWYRYDG